LKSNYKKLGPHIQEVNLRNSDLEIDTLLGVSVKKIFIPSIANTVGTNFKKYKIVRRSQFTYIADTSRRGDKIGLAFLKSHDSALVSQAYTVFEIIDHNKLSPEYLMMWFMRPEFNRYSRYKSHGSVREIFNWEEMCDVELPIPSIEKQQEIVNEYNTITNRITLNEQLNQKLEETAQTLYKHWFVDFEFPNEEGKPYKSSGGEMVYNEELDKEIPEGWEYGCLEKIIEIHDSKRIPLSKSEREEMKGIYPYYGAASLMDYVNDYLFDGTYVLLGEDGSVINEDRSPVLQFVWGKFWVNNHAHVIKGKNHFSQELVYLILKNSDVSGIITGGVQAKINQTNLKNFKILIPKDEVILEFINPVSEIFRLLKVYSEQTVQFNKLLDILLSKMTKVDLEVERVKHK
jgi:type I restriction enzyme S subunit